MYKRQPLESGPSPDAPPSGPSSEPSVGDLEIDEGPVEELPADNPAAASDEEPIVVQPTFTVVEESDSSETADVSPKGSQETADVAPAGGQKEPPKLPFPTEDDSDETEDVPAAAGPGKGPQLPFATEEDSDDEPVSKLSF